MLGNAFKCVQCTSNKVLTRQIRSKSTKQNFSRLSYGLLGGNLLKTLRACTVLEPITRQYSAHFTYVPDTVPSSEGDTARMNLFQAVNNAMDIAMSADPTASKVL